MNQKKKKEDLKEKIIFVARALEKAGMNHATSGNISARIAGGLLITPSSIPYQEMQAKDLISIDMDGRNLEAISTKKYHQPSSEWKLHADILRHRKEINAVVHCHSVNATAIACHKRSIPSFHYMTAAAGGDNIRCAEYATFGSSELSNNTIKALECRFACLLAQHGQVAIANNLENALRLAVEVESLANLYLKASLLGEPKLLSKSEMKRVLKKFKEINYTQLTIDS